MSKIKSIYTDGACSGNPGPGGWGVVIYFQDGSVQELGGFAAQTTNNRMELQAAIAAVEYWQQAGHQTDPLPLYTDSEYVKNGITKWIRGWKKKGWKTATGKDVLNQDLWERLDQLNNATIQWTYVRGHAGNEGNERCDAIARAFSLGKTPHLSQFSAPSPQNSQIEAASVTDEFTNLKVESSRLPGFTSDTATTMNNLSGDVSTGTMTESTPRDVRVAQVRDLLTTLQIADEIARQGYLITSAELADIMDVNASAVTSRGDNWVWRNWIVSRVRREGNQILWQLDRSDQ